VNVAADAQRLDVAREALTSHAWPEAYALLSGVPEHDDPEWFEALADAAWWLSRLDECIVARQRAYALYDERGATRSAAQCAVWLYEHHCFQGHPAVARGWLQRAHRTLEGDEQCVEYGNALLRDAECEHGGGELDKAQQRATEAMQLGRTLRSADLEAEALQAIGRILIDKGEHADGLAHLDEAMLYAVEGRLNPYTTGKVYCSLVSACHDLGDINRALEWSDAVATWAETHPVSMFPGLCRVHRADLLQWRGDWTQAEAEARKASAELESMHLPIASAAQVQIGEIRRRLGDHEGAEAAFQRAEELSGQAWAGIALLRLAQGRRQTAATIITRALEDTSWHRLARSKLLPTYVQVLVAVGELDRARAGAEELIGIAHEYESQMLLASAETARGRVELAGGDPAAACATLHQALGRWSELNVPYEIATTRLLMGHACRDKGDSLGANDSYDAAEAIFERLGAATDARASRDMRVPGALPCGMSEREAEVLRLVAKGRTNRQIATELQLSEKTVARHLSNIFAKIDVASRAAATAFAFENHLVGGD
jgi:ATP/maltotriose-dependent transcriptional regulator MalT